MKSAKRDVVYAVLVGFSCFTFAFSANGILQNWIGLASAKSVFMLALIVAALACQYALLLGLAGLHRRGVQPVKWLFECSPPAIRAVLHLFAFSVFAVGIPAGFLLGGNVLLAASAGLASTISLATELTFQANWGPLAMLLSRREREYMEQANSC